MSSSLISMVTLGSAERPGHLPPMYGNALYVRADGLTPKISNGPNARSRLWPNLDLFLACFCNENASMNFHKYMYLFLGNIFIPPLQKWTAHRSRIALDFTIVCQWLQILNHRLWISSQIYQMKWPIPHNYDPKWPISHRYYRKKANSISTPRTIAHE